MKRVLTSIGFVAAAAAIGCSSATSPGTAAPPAPTPTPPATAVSRVNPYVVEETETYTIQRYPK